MFHYVHNYSYFGLCSCNNSVLFYACEALGSIFAEMFLSIVDDAIIIEIAQAKNFFIFFHRAMMPKMRMIYKEKAPGIIYTGR